MDLIVEIIKERTRENKDEDEDEDYIYTLCFISKNMKMDISVSNENEKSIKSFISGETNYFLIHDQNSSDEGIIKYDKNKNILSVQLHKHMTAVDMMFKVSLQVSLFYKAKIIPFSLITVR